jgi:hypothetical protein
MRQGVLALPLVISWVLLLVWSVKEAMIRSPLLRSFCADAGIWVRGCCGVDPDVTM